MPNHDETLWPGTLVTAEMTMRTEEAVVVPSNAVEVSQTGSIVFVIDKGVAKLRHITTERQVGEETVVTSGLKGGEIVVVDGQIRLRNGTRVESHSKAPPKAVAGS
jgi:multidrug efflux pump subunit AcrA (membrane-fusion protein)